MSSNTLGSRLGSPIIANPNRTSVLRRRLHDELRRRAGGGAARRFATPSRASRSHGSGARPAPRQGRRRRKVHTLNFSSPKNARPPLGNDPRARALLVFTHQLGRTSHSVLDADYCWREFYEPCAGDAKEQAERLQQQREAGSKASDSTQESNALTKYTTTVATRCHRPHTTARNKTTRASTRLSLLQLKLTNHSVSRCPRPSRPSSYITRKDGATTAWFLS